MHPSNSRTGRFYHPEYNCPLGPGRHIVSCRPWYCPLPPPQIDFVVFLMRLCHQNTPQSVAFHPQLGVWSRSRFERRWSGRVSAISRSRADSSRPIWCRRRREGPRGHGRSQKAAASGGRATCGCLAAIFNLLHLCLSSYPLVKILLWLFFAEASVCWSKY